MGSKGRKQAGTLGSSQGYQPTVSALCGREHLSFQLVSPGVCVGESQKERDLAPDVPQKLRKVGTASSGWQS